MAGGLGAAGAVPAYQGNAAASDSGAGGSLDELRASINVKDEPDWKLLVGWLIGTINTVGSYPRWCSR